MTELFKIQGEMLPAVTAITILLATSFPDFFNSLAPSAETISLPLMQPRVIVGVGVSVGVVENGTKTSTGDSKRISTAPLWCRTGRKRGPNRRTGVKNPNPTRKAEPVKEEKAPQVIPVVTKEKAPSVADTVVMKSPAKENTPQVIPVATEEEKAPPVADPLEESPAEENAPVATMEEKVSVVKKEEAEEEAPVATKKKEVEEEAPAVATKEEEAPAATSTSTVT
ncbi:hypothetical protein Bca4012_049079 [Brassica carinata]